MKERLKELAISVWNQLSNEEKEDYYNDCGTIGFIEDIARLLHMSQDLLDSLTEVELNEILDALEA